MWLLTSEAGRLLLASGVSLLAVTGVGVWAYLKGRQAERIKQANLALDAQRERAKTDDEVTKLSDSNVDKYLDPWLRDK